MSSVSGNIHRASDAALHTHVLQGNTNRDAAQRLVLIAFVIVLPS